MANFYIIAYDPATTASADLHKIIESNPSFISWWHYIKTIYIVKTNESLSTVQKDILSKWPKNRFIIIKLDPTVRNGWLPPDAWEWFKKKVDQ